MSALAELSGDELRAIARALEAGYLRPPLTGLALGRYVRSSADVVASELANIAEDDPVRMVNVLALIAAVREKVELPASVELVCTGPEARGAPVRDTRIVVRDLFARAEHSVVVVGYAIYQGREVFSVLAKRMEARPSMTVEMYLDIQRPRGDTSSANELVARFARRFKESEWPGIRMPNVYYDPRSLALELPKRSSLHAKCVVIDDSVAFISSANFTEAAQVRNIEVGVLIKAPFLPMQLAANFRALRDLHLLQRVPGL